MKKLVYIPIIILLFTTLSCLKINKSVIVIRDCTGTYLRLDGKDYHVCNLEKVESFLDGTVITATFKKIKKCNCSANDVPVCLTIHNNEGWIEIKKIN